MQFVYVYRFIKDIVLFYSIFDLLRISDYLGFQFYIFDQ